MERSVHLILWSMWRESWVTQSQLPRRPSDFIQPVHVRNVCRVSVMKEALGGNYLVLCHLKWSICLKIKDLGHRKLIVQLKSPWFSLLSADPKENAKSHQWGREPKYTCSFQNWFCIQSESPNWHAALRRSQHHDGHRSRNIHLKGNASFALCCSSSVQGVNIFPLFFQFFLF